MKPIVVGKFRINSLTKYQVGPGVEIKLASILPGPDDSNDTWRKTAIGNITIIVNDPNVASMFAMRLGQNVVVPFEFEDSSTLNDTSPSSPELLSPADKEQPQG